MRTQGTNAQQAVWQYDGWTLLASSFYRYQQQFRRTNKAKQKFLSSAIVQNQAAVPGRTL